MHWETLMDNLHYLCSPLYFKSRALNLVSNSLWSSSLNTLMWFLAPPKTHPPTEPYCGENSGLTYLSGWHRWRADCWTSLDGRTSLHPGSCTQTEKHTCMYIHARHKHWIINCWLGKSDKFHYLTITLSVHFRKFFSFWGGGEWISWVEIAVLHTL